MTAVDDNVTPGQDLREMLADLPARKDGLALEFR